MSVASWHNTELCPLGTLDYGAPSIEAADTVPFMKLDSFHGFESEVAVAQDVALNRWQLIPSASSGLCAEPPCSSAGRLLQRGSPWGSRCAFGRCAFWRFAFGRGCRQAQPKTECHKGGFFVEHDLSLRPHECV